MGVVSNDTKKPLEAPGLRGHNVVDNAIHAVLLHRNGVLAN